MTDHYAKAQARLKTSHFGAPDRVVAEAIITQTHAVLALAEQQRIANLIALNEQWEDTGYPSLDAGSPMLRPDIARTLRIETP